MHPDLHVHTTQKEQIPFDDFQAGDERAFHQVYDHFYERLFAMATRFLNNTQEIEDIISDAFARLWTERADHTDISAVSIFLHLFVKHRCFDLLRHASIKRQHHARLTDILSDNSYTDFSAEMVKLELFKMIYAEAEKLPAKTREVFMLTYKHGMKPADIARQLEVNVQTVKNQRITAIKMLRKIFEANPLIIAFLASLHDDQQLFF